MKILLSVLIALSAGVAFANEEVGTGEAVVFGNESMTFADEEGQAQELTCPEDSKPVVVCQKNHIDKPQRKPKPHHYRRCRAAYNTCHKHSGEIFCVPKPKRCPLS